MTQTISDSSTENALQCYVILMLFIGINFRMGTS